jgi:hypothetical protein
MKVKKTLSLPKMFKKKKPKLMYYLDLNQKCGLVVGTNRDDLIRINLRINCKSNQFKLKIAKNRI